MPAQQYFLNFIELATAIVKAQGIHEGYWQIVISYDFKAMVIDINNTGPRPTAINALTAIGVARVPKDLKDGLTVDAAIVNPRSLVIPAPFGRVAPA